MNSVYRAVYFRTFVIFFIIVLPFLVLFTLGYDINLNKSSLSKSLLVSLETLPRGSKVLSDSQVIGSTPVEIRGKNNTPITLDIVQNDYFPEKFIFLSSTNNVANISNLALIPQKSSILSKANDGEELVTILNDRLVLVKNGSTFAVKNYTFGGIADTELPVDNQSKVELKNKYFIDIGGAYFFPDSQKLLVFKDEKWSFKDFDKFSFNVDKIVRKNSLFLIQSKSNQLWLYDLDTNQVKYIDSDIYGLSKTANSDFIWILRGSQVYRVDNLSDTNFQISSDQRYYNFNILKKNDNSLFFDAKNLFQGVVLKYDSQIVYIPDFNSKQSVVLTDTAMSFETIGSTIFWLDSKGSLFANNLELKDEVKIGQIDTGSNLLNRVRISYYPTWKRVFVYLENKVYTVWFDKNVLNTSILKYFPYSFSDGNCLVGITEKNQFCIENNSLVSYRNTRIW
jgi:hypothetical protein